MPETVRIFISHHHSPQEDAFTARLKADLRAAGADVWVDDDNVTSDNFVMRINEGLAGRQWLVLVMTPAAVGSVWVQEEVNAALNQVRKGRMRGVIPIVAQQCDDKDIPILWDALHRYDATQDYDKALEGMFRALGLPPKAQVSGEKPDQRLMISLADQQSRRLPVYVLVDTSGSMAGTKIVSIHEGLVLLWNHLARDRVSANVVYLSIISFSNMAYQDALAPIDQFIVPQLSASGSTAMGAALKLLNDSLDHDVNWNRPDRLGDIKPLIFLFTDGQPTDSWTAEAERLRPRISSGSINAIAIGIGDDVDLAILRQVSTASFLIRNVTAQTIREVFLWIGASIQATAAAAQAARAQLPSLPGGLLEQ